MKKVSFSQEETIKKSEGILDIILRQQLSSFTPNCNFKCAAIYNSLLICLFITLGIPIIVQGNSVIENSIDYTNWQFLIN